METLSADVLERAAAYWNAADIGPSRLSWWHIPAIVEDINERVSGVREPGLHQGLNRKLMSLIHAPMKRGVSIAAGDGGKEMHLVRLGLVERFDLTEISERRIESGMARAKALGIADRINYLRIADYADLTEGYDLVYWNNALHHMLDTVAAVQWSRERLTPGGWFVMDDAVCSSRFQWTDRSLAYANAFRNLLGAPAVERRTVEQMIAMDPTEAADSSNILPAIAQSFPDAEVIPTGGAIYVIGLMNILEGIPAPILSQALLLDRALSEAGENIYAVAIAQKA